MGRVLRRCDRHKLAVVVGRRRKQEAAVAGFARRVVRLRGGRDQKGIEFTTTRSISDRKCTLQSIKRTQKEGGLF